MIEPRQYQKDALQKILWAQQLEGNDLIALPTGSGKSVVIAHLAKELNQKILILQPSKEILDQNRKKLALYVDPSEIGVYSASFQSKQVNYYTFATIQSVYKTPELFTEFKIVIVDECHTINPKNQGGMYTQFFKEIGNPKVIGFTATPYRLMQSWKREDGQLQQITAIKMINRLQGRFWSRLIFNINNAELLAQGYLCPLEYIDKSVIDHSQIPLNISQSDFDMKGFEVAISNKELQVLDALRYAQTNSKHVLVFCSSIEQAEHLQKGTPGSFVVTSKTKAKDRDDIIEAFKDGRVKTVFNVGVLTTGFDHPALDCIVLLRPTKSITLYYQMLGRGVRTFPGKTSCKVIDLTSTVKNIGRVESIRVAKDETGKWDLFTDTGKWHDRELYGFKKNNFVNRNRYGGLFRRKREDE